jgi:hypothetical protein
MCENFKKLKNKISVSTMGELTDIPHFRLFESALRLHCWESEKILIYLRYLMDEK